MPNPDLCFNAYTPITCLDYETYRQNPSAGYLTVKCTDSSLPYCLTLTTDGLSPQFGCASTSYPRVHSFLPIATSSIVAPNTFPAQTTATTIPPSRTPTPISNNDSNPGNKRKSRLPTSAKAGIGSAVGVVTLAVIAFLSFCFRRRRNRAHVSPTDGGAEPVMAQSNNTPKAAQPVQQQYRQQPQGYQEAVPVQQQFQPQPQSNQYANTKLPDPADSPSDLAPNYTSGSQHISAAFIPPNEPTDDPNTVRI